MDHQTFPGSMLRAEKKRVYVRPAVTDLGDAMAKTLGAPEGNVDEPFAPGQHWSFTTNGPF